MKHCQNCQEPLPKTMDRCPICGQEVSDFKPKKNNRKREPEEPQRNPIDLGTYYDDVVPADAEELKNRSGDNSLALKLTLLGVGVAIVVATCITLLVLFGGDI